jgi:hypothetical protein
VVNALTTETLALTLFDDESLRQARRFARVNAEHCGLENSGDDIEQIVAELLTGSRSKQNPTDLQISEDDDGLVVSANLSGASILEMTDLAERVLSRLSTSWGWTAGPLGVHVWSHVRH